MSIAFVGLNHKTASIDMRERVAFSDTSLPDALATLLERADVEEAVILSTCNRTEIYASVRDRANGFDLLTDFISGYRDVSAHELVPHLYAGDGLDAATHLFNVVCSLDSLVLGEQQILGQVRKAFATASENGATGSLRRAAQLAALRPDIAFCDIRGNVETRIGKVRDGAFDATVLAVAGVERMGMDDCIAERFPTDVMIPAVGQGAIGIETRSKDEDVRAAVVAVSCDDTMRDVSAERIVMRALEGGCQVPLGAYARERDGAYALDAFVSSLDGSQVARVSLEGRADQSWELALRAVDGLLSQGAREILEAIR